jgi:hypothetical protein
LAGDPCGDGPDHPLRGGDAGVGEAEGRGLLRPLTLPCTPVFFELECGDWTAEAEGALRKSIAQAAGSEP